MQYRNTQMKAARRYIDILMRRSIESRIQHWPRTQDKDRSVCEPRPSPTAEVISTPRLGGLHHRYAWREAA